MGDELEMVVVVGFACAMGLSSCAVVKERFRVCFMKGACSVDDELDETAAGLEFASGYSSCSVSQR